MPISVGLMQAQRIKFYHTSAAFSSISPPAGSGQCGETCTIHVTITNVDGGPAPTGPFNIFDMVSDSVVVSGTVTAGTGIVSFPISVAHLFFYVQYLGAEIKSVPPTVDYQFGPSNSAPVLYNGTIASTTTTITSPANNTNFCFTANESVTAMVTSGGTVTGGNIDFRLWSNDTTFVSLPSSTVTSGVATSQIPSGTTTEGNSYYIQALYDGNACFGSSSSMPGSSGIKVNSTDALATTTTVVPTDSDYTFCYYNTKQFTVTVPGPMDGYAPTSGLVTLFSSTGDFAYELTSGNLSGSDSIVLTAPGSSVSFYVYAVFSGDGYCYGGSTSSSISVNAFLNSMTISNYSVPTYGCSIDLQNFYFQVHIGAGGTASGTFYLQSSTYGQLASQTLSVSNGSIVLFSNVTVPAGNQYLYVIFVHNTTVNCFGDYYQPSFLYDSQGYVTPSIVLSTSASDFNFEPVTLTVRAYHNGGFTSLGGNIYYSWYAPDGSYHTDPSNPYPSSDNGDPVTHSVTYSTPPGGQIGTYTFYAYYAPTHCYYAEYSNAANYNSQEQIR